MQFIAKRFFVISFGNAVELYDDKEKMTELVAQIMQIDHSWEKSAEQYIDLYNSIQLK